MVCQLAISQVRLSEDYLMGYHDLFVRKRIPDSGPVPAPGGRRGYVWRAVLPRPSCAGFCESNRRGGAVRSQRDGSDQLHEFLARRRARSRARAAHLVGFDHRISSALWSRKAVPRLLVEQDEHLDPPYEPAITAVSSCAIKSPLCRSPAGT